MGQSRSRGGSTRRDQRLKGVSPGHPSSFFSDEDETGGQIQGRQIPDLFESITIPQLLDHEVGRLVQSRAVGEPFDRDLASIESDDRIGIADSPVEFLAADLG